jgi:hypothetical protein
MTLIKTLAGDDLPDNTPKITDNLHSPNQTSDFISRGDDVTSPNCDELDKMWVWDRKPLHRDKAKKFTPKCDPGSWLSLIMK